MSLGGDGDQVFLHGYIDSDRYDLNNDITQPSGVSLVDVCTLYPRVRVRVT